MKSNTESQDDPVKTPKKTWQKPEIHLLDTSGINSGGNPGLHEQNYDGTIGTNPASMFNPNIQYRLHPKSAPASWYRNADHRLNFYYS